MCERVDERVCEPFTALGIKWDEEVTLVKVKKTTLSGNRWRPAVMEF